MSLPGREERGMSGRGRFNLGGEGKGHDAQAYLSRRATEKTTFAKEGANLITNF